VSASARQTTERVDLQRLFVAFVLFLLSARLLLLIDRYSVNVLFWDQWDFMQPLMTDAGLWELFRSQHGPHRQGIAFLLTAGLAWLSDWNTRVDAVAIGLIVCSAAALALWLQQRLRGRLTWSDAAIPLIVLTPAQYGIFIHTPNASHGAAPLLLLVAWCLALTIEEQKRRYAALLLLEFMLVSTGFGMFAGVLTPLYFAAEVLRIRRAPHTPGARAAAAGLALSLLCAGLFFVGYAFDPASPGFRPEDSLSTQLPRFVALMFANVLGLKGVSGWPVFAGSLFAIVAVAIAGRRAIHVGSRHTARGERVQSEVICALILFSLLFCATAAFGRVSLGLPGAQSTRYVPLVVPAFIGVQLHLAAWCDGLARWRGLAVRAAVVAGLIAATFPMRSSEYDFMQSLAARKARWVETYLETHDMTAADRSARLRIYPWPEAQNEIKAKLDWLEARHLNLFSDD
jgi:hypothetical protein